MNIVLKGDAILFIEKSLNTFGASVQNVQYKNIDKKRKFKVKQEPDY